MGVYFNERITKWAPGAISGVLVAGAMDGETALTSYEPGKIYIDNAGNLYVSDVFNYRVQKWTVPTINREYMPTTPGTYTALVEAGNGSTVRSEPQVVNPIAQPSISISTPNTNIGPCTLVTFTAQAIDGRTSPSFQWQINGINTRANGRLLPVPL